MKLNQFSIWDKVFVQYKMELTKAEKMLKADINQKKREIIINPKIVFRIININRSTN